MAKMRAVQVPKAGGELEMVEREIPEPRPGTVRVKVQACGICHSDSVTVEGLLPGIEYPRVPGHEEKLQELRDRRILIDGAPTQGQGVLLQIFTQNVVGPCFFEIIQRKGENKMIAAIKASRAAWPTEVDSV